MASDYGEKLKDPRWKARRAEILERDAHRCVRCSAADVPLQVHHTYYEMGVEPWEYPETSLITVCVPCHEIEDRQRVTLRELIGRIPPGARDRLRGYVNGLCRKAFYELGDKNIDINLHNENDDVARGIADAFGLEVLADEFVMMLYAFDRQVKVSDVIEMRQLVVDAMKSQAATWRATDAAQEAT